MPKSPPAYDYYNPSTWLVAPEDVEEEENTFTAARNARTADAAELSAAAALEASKTNDVFAKLALKIHRANEKEQEEGGAYPEQHAGQAVPNEASSAKRCESLVRNQDSAAGVSAEDASLGLWTRCDSPPELKVRVWPSLHHTQFFKYFAYK